MVGLARGDYLFFLAHDWGSVLMSFFYEFIDYMTPILEYYRVIRQRKTI